VVGGTIVSVFDDDDDDDERPVYRTCNVCGRKSPPTSTAYTLVSTKHGWRCTRRTEGGSLVAEWWCPTCWQEEKARSGRVTIPPTEPTGGESDK
jgi:hypothetical protein